MEQEAVEQHPEVDVSFAPTPAFVAEFGQEEAARQAVLFDAPTWQVSGKAPTLALRATRDVAAVEGATATAGVGRDDDDLILIALAGFVIGATTAYFVWKLVARISSSGAISTSP